LAGASTDPGCAASTITLKQGIETRLRQAVPEVKSVESV
jgi:Fe-S cluster biogenesis protein NfuA